MFSFKYFVLSVFLCCFYFSSSAQEQTLKLSTVVNADKSVDIKFEKTDIGSVTVFLDMKELSNSNLPNRVFSVNGYNGRLVSLSPLNKEQSIGYSYSYRYIRGKLLPKINPDLVYLLPYTDGTNVIRVAESQFLSSKYFGAQEPEDWKVYHFYTSDAATVTATRKGTVIQVRDMHDDSQLKDVSYTSKTNNILIEHPDGTMMEYDGFQLGSIKVKVGDTVFPGQELGTNVRRSNDKYSISCSLYYLKRPIQSSDANRRMSESSSYYGWVTPLYLTEKGAIILEKDKNYTATTDESVITKEMSKRELKKYKK